MFADAGDVSQSKQFRFDHPQTTLGLGFRYHTIIGPIRFDAGWRVPGAQVIGKDERDPERAGKPSDASLLFFGFPGALHLTIGESF
ncbi:MAG: hypothetical protein IPJ88_15815 [Myxococcales bacterium]|nr:MAG: hypothetical protein IPJ88_15815 [Myxococcales bacterium]